MRRLHLVELEDEPYRWEIGEARGKGGPAPVTYLLGWPEG